MKPLRDYIFIVLFLSTLSLKAVEISGTISYERVNVKNSGGSSMLDYSNITKESAKQVSLVAIDRSNNLIDSTFTDDKGEYTLSNIPTNTDIKIRVYAKMKKSNRWDLKVLDNKDGNSLYGIEGNFRNSGNSNTIRDLTALSSDRSSPPFAILDSIYLAMRRFIALDSSINFPPLKVNWSTKNVDTGTYYDGVDTIMMQGDKQGDSDEYDDHIVIHEWGHYFEKNFSRADNIGGQHGTGEYLDIRVAFGEGWGNSLSSMITDDPIYFDTMGSSGWNMNVETAIHEKEGWFSESSIQRILYDLYDSHNDAKDKLSLGLKPIYEVLTNGEKNTPAFTSIFSFITELKKAYPNHTSKIDDITSMEEIATIEDSYGSNRISNLESGSLPLYKELIVDKTLGNICTLSYYGRYNKLDNHKYIRFTINNNGTYPIEVKEYNGNSSDPEFQLFKSSPFENISTNEGSKKGIEKDSFALTKGEYLLDIYDSNNIDRACYNVSVGEVTTVDNSTDNNSSMDTNSDNNGEQTTSTVGLGLPKNTLFSIIIMLFILFAPLFLIRKEIKI